MLRIERRAIEDAELRLMNVNRMRVGREVADLPHLGTDARVLRQRIHPRQRIAGPVAVDGAEQSDRRSERDGTRIAARRLSDRDRRMCRLGLATTLTVLESSSFNETRRRRAVDGCGVTGRRQAPASSGDDAPIDRPRRAHAELHDRAGGLRIGGREVDARHTAAKRRVGSDVEQRDRRARPARA